MADNLDIQQKILAAIEAQNKLLGQGTVLINSQAEAYTNLLGVISDSSALDGLINKLGTAASAMQKMSADASAAGKSTAESFDLSLAAVTKLQDKMSSMGDLARGKLPQAFQAVSKVISEMPHAGEIFDVTEADIDNLFAAPIKSLDGMTTNFKKMADVAETASKRSSASFNVTGKDIDRLFGKQKEYGSYLQVGWMTAVAGAAGALEGLVAQFQSLIAIGKGIFSVFEGVASGAWKITKSILAIPFKIMDSLIEKAQAGAGGNEIAQAYEDVRKQFGSFKQEVAKNVITAARSMQGELGKTGLSVYRVLGNVAERLKFVTELASKMGPTFSVLGKEIAENAEEMVAYQKGLGLSAEEMKGVGARAISMGTTLTEQFKEITNFSLQMGDAFGLSSKEISRDMGMMIKDVKNFGSLSIKQMSEVAVYTKKLGIEFTKLQGLIDKFDTFESAAESSAKLSQAFGVNINAFEMMKKQSPADRMDELRKSFVLAGKSADNLSRQELALITDATGLDAETAKQALSNKNLGLSMDEIKKKSDVAQKKQLSQAEAMSKLGDAIERLVQTGQTGFKGFFDAFLQGIERGIGSSPEFIKLMMKIRQSLLQVFQTGIELGRWLVQNFAGLKDMITGLTERLPGIVNFFKGFSESIKEFVSGKLDFKGFMDKVRSQFLDYFDTQKGPAVKILNGMKLFFSKLVDIAAGGLKFFVTKLTEGLKMGTEFLKDPKKFLDKAVTGAGAGKSFMMEILKPLIEAVKDKKMWQDLWSAFVGFASEIWKNVKSVFMKIIAEIPPGFWIGLGVFLFGPAAVKGIAMAGAEMIFKGGTIALKQGLGLLSKAAESSGGIMSKLIGPLVGNPYVLAGAAIAALAVAGVVISKGVEKFKDDVVKKVGKGDEATFGAGLAGIAQVLSFGTMSDDVARDFAINAAKITKVIEKGVESIFGKDVAQDLRSIFFSQFRVVLDIGDFVRAIFNADGPMVAKSIMRFGMDALELFVASFKFVFLTLPVKVTEWIIDMADSLSDTLTGLFDFDSGNSIFDSNFVNTLLGSVDRIGDMFVDGAYMIGRVLSKAFFLVFTKLPQTLFSVVFKLPAAVFGYIADGIKSFVGEKSPWYLAFKDVQTIFKNIGDFIVFSGKFLADAASKVWQGIKDALTGKKNVGDAFNDTMLSLDVEKGFKEYQKNLKNVAEKVKDANTKAIADAVPDPVEIAKADPSTFLTKASQAIDSLKGLKTGLSTIDEKDLAKTVQNYQKVLSSFGDEKTLTLATGRAKLISDLVEVMSKIAVSVATFTQAASKFTFTDIDSAVSTIKSIGSIQLTEPGNPETFKKYGEIALSLKSVVDSLLVVKDAAGKLDSGKLSIAIMSIAETANGIKNIPEVSKPPGLDALKSTLEALSGASKNALEFKQQMDKIGKPDVFRNNVDVMVVMIDSLASKLNGLSEISSVDLTKLTNASSAFDKLADFDKVSSSIVKKIESGGIQRSFQAIVDMVKKVQEMNDSISQMTQKPIEIKTHLQELANKLGLGSNQAYQIKNSGVEINISLEVKMDAGTVEEVIVKRNSSKIRKAFAATGMKEGDSLSKTLGPGTGPS